jgi:hypothetical protein
MVKILIMVLFFLFPTLADAHVQDVGEKSPNYVGVTGGKTYTLTVVVGSNDFYYCYYSSSSKYWIRARDDRARILISWSPTINAKSPNITDY